MDQPEGADAAPLDVPADSEVQATLQGQVLGTPAYMAPEQAEGRLDQLGPATDVYGLGAILYEILTGRPPFSGPETTQLLRQVIHEAPARPGSLVAGTPRGLEAVCLKALAKKPADRYDSASALASDIRHYLADEPVSAYRDPLPTRLGRKARRHRTLVAGMAAAALVAMVSLTAATVLLSAANRRESEARRLAQERGEEAERESAKARANFQLAREAVEEYCTKVSDDPRLKDKDLEELRKDLLRSAVKFHQEFIKQHGDDSELRADLGRAHLDLARLLYDTETPAVAIEVSRQAVAEHERLFKQNPEDKDHPLQLGLSLTTLGLALDKNGQTEEARAVYSRAVEILEEAGRRHGVSLLLRRAIIRVCNHLSFLLMHRLGAPQGALAILQKGVDVLQQERPGLALEPFDLLAKAEAYACFGELLVEQGRANEGLPWCAKAVQTVEPLLAGGALTNQIHFGLSSMYAHIGRAHKDASDFPKALQAFGNAIQHDLKLVAAHPAVSIYQQYLGTDYGDLGRLQIRAGQPEEGLANLRRSLEVKEKLVARYPQVPDFTANLARSLYDLARRVSDREQAWAYQRRSESLLRRLTASHPKVVTYQLTLVSSISIRAELHGKANEIQQKLAALNQGIDLLEQLIKTSDVPAYRQHLLGYYFVKTETCLHLDRVDQAAASFGKAIAMSPRDPKPLYSLATSLMRKGRLDEAILGLRRAVALKPEYAEAQCNLGHCLVRQGRFSEGLAALQRGHEIGIKQPDWKYESLSWVRHAEKMSQLDTRLNGVLAKKAQPADARERLAMADLCRQYKHLYATSALFYAAAFADDPKLAEDRKELHRYNAACVAALAGSGKGADAGKIDDKERTRWRKQAHDWLTAELALWARPAEKPGPTDGPAIRKQLQHWQTDTDLAGVRDQTALARLDAGEQQQWRRIWQEVDGLLQKLAKTK
jgi:tetratricopeptide (TPR) repeat protein